MWSLAVWCNSFLLPFSTNIYLCEHEHECMHEYEHECMLEYEHECEREHEDEREHECARNKVKSNDATRTMQ